MSDLIDRQTWATLESMSDATFLRELIEVYQADSPQLIEQMRAGLAGGVVEQVRRSAHSLKSNSASLGALRLSEAARALETLARGGTLDGADDWLAVIEEEYACLQPELDRLKQNAG
ncbi:MAG: Hpt domain-containing protein [Chloroflexota bacterium]